MSDYSAWTIQDLGARILEWRLRLARATSRANLLSIWGEVEVMEREFGRAVFENRS